MAWSDAARKAALETRRLRAKNKVRVSKVKATYKAGHAVEMRHPNKWGTGPWKKSEGGISGRVIRKDHRGWLTVGTSDGKRVTMPAAYFRKGR